jgi:tRNA uracil 4-sulfurtransferase
MKTVQIVRYGEINIKGKNRDVFEKQLAANIKTCLKYNDIPYERVERKRNRIFVHTDANVSPLRTVFGISSFSRAIVFEYDKEELKKQIRKLIEGIKFNSFRVSVQRLDKSFPFTSMELEREMGAYVVEICKKKVSLKEFDLNIQIEFALGEVYLFTERVKCFDGLPPGTEGNVCMELHDEKSTLTALLMMKRGCKCFFTGKQPTNANLLEKYLHRKVFIESEDLKTVMKNKGCLAHIVPDTFPDIQKYEDERVLRPLVALTKEQIQSTLNMFEEAAA